MFDIGFSELLLVGLIALLVLGPERLPTAARVTGLWLGRIKRGFNNIKADIEREIGADELRLQLHNEEILAKERKMLEETANQAKESLAEASQQVKTEIDSAASNAQSNTNAAPSAQEPEKE